jgi:hypothetical protein
VLQVLGGKYNVSIELLEYLPDRELLGISGFATYQRCDASAPQAGRVRTSARVRAARRDYRWRNRASDRMACDPDRMALDL